MSVRVNLLPDEVRQRGEANRSRILAGVAGLVFLLILGALSFMQRQEISDTEQQLAQAEERNAALQADIAALQPFADLENRAQLAMNTVSLAMSGERSLATVLQDLSAVMPPNAQLDNLTVTLLPEPASPVAGGERVVYGRLTGAGRVLDGVAPGVERLIIDLDRVAAFDNAYVTTSTVDEDNVATFTLDIELGPEILSQRYQLVDATGATDAADAADATEETP